jgi:hypothetical protein
VGLIGNLVYSIEKVGLIGSLVYSIERFLVWVYLLAQEGLEGSGQHVHQGAGSVGEL